VLVGVPAATRTRSSACIPHFVFSNKLEYQRNLELELSIGHFMVGEVARGLSLFGGASSEVRRCDCSVVV